MRAGSAEIGVTFLRGEGHPLVAPLEAVGLAAAGSGRLDAAERGGIPQPVRAILEDPTVRKMSGDLKADLLTLRREGMTPRAA